MTILNFLFWLTLSVTGPSHMESEIIPVAVNERGEILCQTRLSKNEMGGYSIMPVTYGYVVITGDTIIEFNSTEFNPGNYSGYESQDSALTHLDSIFRICMINTDPGKIEQDILEKYGFTDCNASGYIVDTLVSITDFETNWNIDLEAQIQYSLDRARSTSYSGTEDIHVMYDFGHVLILQNTRNELDEVRIGALFDYGYSWENRQGEEEILEFDITSVTGILRMP